jgi:hypothetical protein
MSTMLLSWCRWQNGLLVLGRVVDTGFAALGQSWLDAVRVRCGRLEPDWSPDHHDADEELRLMVALSCACFH